MAYNHCDVNLYQPYVQIYQTETCLKNTKTTIKQNTQNNNKTNTTTITKLNLTFMKLTGTVLSSVHLAKHCAPHKVWTVSSSILSSWATAANRLITKVTVTRETSGMFPADRPSDDKSLVIASHLAAYPAPLSSVLLLSVLYARNPRV